MKTILLFLQDFQDAIFGACMQGLAACHTVFCVVVGAALSFFGWFLLKLFKAKKGGGK